MAELSRLSLLRGLAQRVRPALAGRTRAEAGEPSAAESLRVLMLPDATAGNPYQRRLADALRRRGAEVRMAPPRGLLPLLGAVLGRWRPQVLHLHWTHRLSLSRNAPLTLLKSLRFLTELAALRLAGVRIVWTAHNLLEHERRYPRLELLTQRLAARLYHRVIVHGPEARRVVSDGLSVPPYRRHRLHCVPHGHFVGAYPESVTRAAARRELGVSAHASPVFVHFGRIRPYKGVWQLMDALHGLALPDAMLIVAGQPWDRATEDELARRAAGDRRIALFCGFIPDERIQYFMKAADAVVLPYRDVLTSGTAMLAMSFARPVIMPRYGCSRDMTGCSQGVLYDPEDPGGLAAAMRRASEVDLQARGAASRELVLGADWDVIASRTLAAYLGEEVGW